MWHEPHCWAMKSFLPVFTFPTIFGARRRGESVRTQRTRRRRKRERRRLGRASHRPHSMPDSIQQLLTLVLPCSKTAPSRINLIVTQAITHPPTRGLHHLRRPAFRVIAAGRRALSSPARGRAAVPQLARTLLCQSQWLPGPLASPHGAAAATARPATAVSVSAAAGSGFATEDFPFSASNVHHYGHGDSRCRRRPGRTRRAAPRADHAGLRRRARRATARRRCSGCART